MKRTFLLLLVIALLVMNCFAAGTAEENAALRKDVLVLFTSDVHCGVDQGFTYAGLKAIKDAAIDAGDHVMLVDDGDSIQGEPIGILTQGQANVELMNACGYDIAIPGNHEFDYGMERFMELVEMADFPYISCNFHREGELVFDPYVIREFDGVKFGFVGATTPESLTSSTPRYFQDENGNYIYDFSQGGDGSDFYAAVQNAVDDARAEGAAYVFLIAHLGNEASCHPYTYADVIEHTNGIDAVLDGHSHDTGKVVMKNKDGKSVIRQACGTKLASIGWMRVSAEDGTVETGLYNWNNDVPAPELLGIWNRMSVELEKADNIRKQLEEVVGHAAVELTVNDPEAKDESGKPLRIVRNAETNLGDFCADVMRAVAGADVGVANGGAIRVSIEKGDITLNDLLSVYPFGNKLMMAEVTGQQLLNALEWGVRVLPSESGAFLHVSGMTYEVHTGIKSTCTKDDNGLFTGVAGEYRVQNVMVNGEPLDLEKTYTVVSTSNVIVNHGDGQTAFDGAKIVWTSDELDYQIMKDYIQSLPDGVVGEGYENPYGQERIVAVE
ncbi:MAG: bifunctional metallophosphatase/5'-nucleotidase [Clostridia bacterium]|nr:bifunctional metallophosphatase/5'-nucleotidase [Clostridia bacterium]